VLADALLVAWIVLFALAGVARGLVAQALALVGVVSGVVIGAAVAPHLVGDAAASVPLASLAGAAIGAFVLGIVAGRLAGGADAALAGRPRLRAADRGAGGAAGALVGIALAWAVAVVLLHQPALGLRRHVQDSTLLLALVRAVPPEPVLRTLERLDPLPLLPELAPRSLPPPDPSVLRAPGARAAAASVVKVEGTSCGLGVQGSGWVVHPELVATNAHVVAGQTDTRVLAPGGAVRDGTLVYLDGGNDVALVRVPGLGVRPLRTDAGGDFPRRVALLGYPHDGPLRATAGTAGSPRTVIAPDAYERRLRPRLVVPVRGAVEPGESGGPVVDARGRAVAMIFGGARDGRGGFAVPVSLVIRGLAQADRPVAPGDCVGQ